MKFFSLDGWVDNFIKDKSLDSNTYLNFCKPIFEWLYNIEIKDDFSFSNDINEKSLNSAKETIRKYINFNDFLYYGCKDESDDSDINKEFDNINNLIMDDDFEEFYQRIVYNLVITAYISLKYKKYEDYTTNIYKLCPDIEERSNFYKSAEKMQLHSILGQLMGIKCQNVFKERYRIPCFQDQLIKNMISTIGKNFFYTKADDLLKQKESGNNIYEKSGIPTNNFLKKLFCDLDTGNNETDKIVAYYIIERIFCFNLNYNIVNILKNSGIHDIARYRKKIIKKFHLLFKIPDISGRISYFNAFIKLCNEKALTDINSNILNECENFLKYMNYYYIPKIEFIFLFFYEKFRRDINDDTIIENLLKDYIINNCIYPKNSKEYMKNIYHDSNKSNHDTDILNYMSDIILENFKIPYTVCELEKHIKNEPQDIKNEKYIEVIVENIINHKSPFVSYSEIQGICKNCESSIFFDIYNKSLKKFESKSPDDITDLCQILQDINNDVSE